MATHTWTNTPVISKVNINNEDKFIKDAEVRALIDTEGTGILAQIATNAAAIAQEVTDRGAAISAEAAARESADNALDARLDVIEGADTVDGSIKKALKDAKAYTDAEIAALDVDALEIDADETVASISEQDGKIVVTKQDIAIAHAQVTDAGSAITANVLTGDIKDAATSANLTSSKQVTDYVTERIAGLGAGVEFIGTTVLAVGETVFAAISRVVTAAGTGHPKKGDLVIIQGVDGGNSEYICVTNGATSMDGWEELGNVGLYATKAELYAEELRATEVEEALDERLDTLEGGDTVEGSVAYSIKNAIEALDATKSQTAGTDGLALSITEVDGKITAISGSIAANTYDASGAAADVKEELLGDAATDYNTLGKLEDKIQAEATAARAAEQANSTAISNEVTRATGKEGELTTAISNEVTRATNIEEGLDGRLDVIEGDATTAGSIKKAVADEAARINAITGTPDTGKTLQEEIDALEAVVELGVVASVTAKANTAISVDNTDTTKPVVGLNIDNTQGTAVTMTQSTNGLKVVVGDASTSAKGIVSLSDSLTSDSSTVAATSKAVKSLEDKKLDESKLDETTQFAVAGLVASYNASSETLTFTDATKKTVMAASV